MTLTQITPMNSREPYRALKLDRDAVYDDRSQLVQLHNLLKSHNARPYYPMTLRPDEPHSPDSQPRSESILRKRSRSERPEGVVGEDDVSDACRPLPLLALVALLLT